ncbi:MAG: PEP/pyruvate-binding domain-containing protein [Hyphomicrobiales bacterium]
MRVKPRTFTLFNRAKHPLDLNFFFLITLLAALAAFSASAFAFQAQGLSKEVQRELKKHWAPSMSKIKGPFGPNTCVCTDGRSAPVQSKSGAIRNICGEKTLFCSAFKAPWGKELENYGVYVANILSRDLYEWDRFPDHHNLVRGFILEKFIIATYPKHKLSEMRQYGGLSGAEYESVAEPKFFEKYLSLPSFNDFRHFILAYELQKRFFSRGDFGKMQEVRNMASRIQKRDKKFKPLRDAVHNQVSAALLPLLIADRDKRPAGQTRKMVEELIDEIEKLTAMTDDSLDPLIAEIEDAALKKEVQGLLSDDNSDRIDALANVMINNRQKIAFRKVSPADARRLVDINVVATAIIQSQGSKLLETGGLKTVKDHVQMLHSLVDASYGTGLLTTRERNAAIADLNDILAKPDIDREELIERLKNVRRVVEWAQNGAMLAFSEVWAPWTFLVPDAGHIGDDILRGSPLLLLAQVERRLSDFAAGTNRPLHLVFGQEFYNGVRALNPGMAKGKFLLNPKQGEYQRHEIIALEQTPADLEPAAGIITKGEGNVVSHVQLLARALGIPNAVTDDTAFKALEKYAGKEVFLIATPRGRVIIKEASEMSEQDNAIFEEYTRNQKRTSDGSLGGSKGKLHIDIDKIDLSANMPVDMASLRIKDSGVQSGPKAAFLGELQNLFPDNVAPGVVVPFGVYHDHLKRTTVVVPKQLEGKGLAKNGEPINEFLKRTYGTFFGDMVSAGATEKELADWIKPRLAVIRHSIRQETLDENVKQSIVTHLDKLGLLDPADKNRTIGVFVRSDTNVEDLENFNGAGLNLTIFNLKSLDDVFEGLKRVWASPFTYRSFSWRQTLIDKPMWVLPSVVILQSVSSEKSGVAITADLEHGDPEKVLIATSEGVGGAVDGTPAETILWSNQGVELITMFKSPQRRLLKPDGGSEIVPATGSEFVLNDKELSQLVQASQKIRQTFPAAKDSSGNARPWDIEFGFAEGKLWLFQSRPFIGNDELSNVPALAALDDQTAKPTGTLSLEEMVK